MGFGRSGFAVALAGVRGIAIAARIARLWRQCCRQTRLKDCVCVRMSDKESERDRLVGRHSGIRGTISCDASCSAIPWESLNGGSRMRA